MLRCILIDHDKDFCKIFQSLLDTIDEIEILSVENDPTQAVIKVCSLKPDIVFLAVVMPGLTGFEVIKNIRCEGVFPQFVFITSYQEYAIKAIKEGAFDYILKPLDIDELKQCIERYLGKKENKQFSNHLEKILTPREKKVLQLICEGKTSREIAEELFISKTTVDTHRKHIIEKVGCKNISELLAKYSNHL